MMEEICVSDYAVHNPFVVSIWTNVSFSRRASVCGSNQRTNTGFCDYLQATDGRDNMLNHYQRGLIIYDARPFDCCANLKSNDMSVLERSTIAGKIKIYLNRDYAAYSHGKFSFEKR